jgi:hypothetical protein
MFERNSRNTNNTNGYTRNVSNSRETSTGNHQEHKGRNIMTAYNSRNPSNSRNESNNRTANTVWTLSKAGILAKTVKPGTAWRRPQQLRQWEHHSVNSRRETRNNSTSISRDANSTI